MQTSSDSPFLRGHKELAAYAHVGTTLAHRWIIEGVIPSFRVGCARVRLLRKTDVDAFLDRCERE